MSDEDTLQTSDPAMDSGASAPAPQDTPMDTGAPTQQDAATGQPNPATGSPDPSQSTAVAPTNAAPPQPSVNWEKRYTDLQSFADRRVSMMQQQMKAYEAQLAQFRAQAEQTTKAQTAHPWSKDSPKNAQFRSVMERAKGIKKQLQAAQSLQDPVQRDAALNAIAAGISPEEREQLSAFQEQQQEFQNNFFADPKSAIGPMVQEIAQQVFTSMREEFKGRLQVDQDFDSPMLKPILENPTYAGYLQDKLSKGIPYEEAMEMVKLRAAVSMLQTQQRGMGTQVAAAQEQQRLAKTRASNITAPDPAASAPDPYLLAKKEAASKGIMPGSAQFNAILAKYTNNI